MALSEKQWRVMGHAVNDSFGLLAGGAVRSGKTHAINLSFALWAAKQSVGHYCVLMGNSIESVMRNAGYDLINAFRELGIRCDLSRSLGTHIWWEHGGVRNKIWIIGASDERSRKRIQGLTLKGLYVDEVCLVPQDAYVQALTRLSVEGSKFWASFNPESPAHWMKREVIDNLDTLSTPDHPIDLLYFSMDDNPTLSDAVKERYRQSFTGHWHKRYIQGEWAGATGLVFPKWSRSEMDPRAPVKPVLALDWGVSTVLTVLMVKKGNVVAEYYWDSRKQGVLDEIEQLANIVAWYRSLNPQWDMAGVVLYVDPTCPPTWKRRLRKAGFNVRMADHDVVPGIVTTATRLSTKDILIGDCPNLIDELRSYQWDDKKADVGIDAPSKVNDHAVDALRYYAHTTGKIIRSIGRTPTVREALRVAAA